MRIYLRRSVIDYNLLEEDLYILEKNGFRRVAYQNDYTDPLVKDFIRENNLIFQGVSGAGNQAEAFYIKEDDGD
jgi:hypothetical protein